MATGGRSNSDVVRGILLEMSDVLRSKADQMSSKSRDHRDANESRSDRVDGKSLQ